MMMAFTCAKMAVLAPIPMARETTATAVNAGFLTSRRTAKRTSCIRRSMCRAPGGDLWIAASLRGAKARIGVEGDLPTQRDLRDGEEPGFGEQVRRLQLGGWLEPFPAPTDGVISYSVAQRTAELDVRMAIGGIAIGLMASLALTWAIGSLLVGVTPTDPVTFLGVSLLLAAVALIASYIPARRAARVDPMLALRAE